MSTFPTRPRPVASLPMDTDNALKFLHARILNAEVDAEDLRSTVAALADRVDDLERAAETDGPTLPAGAPPIPEYYAVWRPYGWLVTAAPDQYPEALAVVPLKPVTS
jgi:hypothetical protein